MDAPAQSVRTPPGSTTVTPMPSGATSRASTDTDTGTRRQVVVDAVAALLT
ncbi:hypothetical protein UO65_1496 [Actinokineospora spheciospongiae]|uniref:Uncharacterized protein n=1 Tax=Actinokineospora spheciospongiae TaxID=909613 RepID=W7J2I9_9PSEU|nr:hypothetical protein UO65_1496 [Actinokineospora spheciospongiae]